MSGRDLSPTMTSRPWVHNGLFVGTLRDGQPFVYEGGLVRVNVPDGDPTDHGKLWEAAMETVFVQVAALDARGDRTPVEGAPLELTGCLEVASGDWLLLWRVACVEVVTH